MKQLSTSIAICILAILFAQNTLAKDPTNWELRGTSKIDQQRLYNIAKKLGCANNYFDNEMKCWQLYAEAGWDARLFMSESTISFKKSYVYLRECEKKNRHNHCVWNDEEMVYNVGESRNLDAFEEAPL